MDATQTRCKEGELGGSTNNPVSKRPPVLFVKTDETQLLHKTRRRSRTECWTKSRDFEQSVFENATNAQKTTNEDWLFFRKMSERIIGILLLSNNNLAQAKQYRNIWADVSNHNVCFSRRHKSPPNLVEDPTYLKLSATTTTDPGAT